MDSGVKTISLATRAVQTPPSGIREIVHLALHLQQEGREVIRLEVGESDTGTPKPIVQAALRDALAGQTRYTASAGQAELRHALVAKLARVNDIRVEPDNLVVTVGAVQALWLALASTCDPGDEVLIPDPGWPNYEMIAIMIGAQAVRYRCPPVGGFMPDLDEIRSLMGPRTRAIVVNSPQNPSGVVYPRAVVEELLMLAEQHEVLVISDEAYDELYFGDRPCSPGHVAPIESRRWLATYSLSKTYAMTGWRVGYLIAPREVAALAAKLQESTVSCVSAVSQRAALAALTGPQEFVVRQREETLARRDQVLARLRPTGRVAYVPEGAFYILVDVRPHEDRQFALSLLHERGVGVAPGRAFGDVARGFVRVCYAAGGDRLLEGIDRILVMLDSAR